MYQIRAKNLTVGQMVWLNSDYPKEIKSLVVTPRGRINVGFKVFEPEQKIDILSQAEIESFRRAMSEAIKDTRPGEYKDVIHSIHNNFNLVFEYRFDSDRMKRDEDEEKQQKELNDKLKRDSALTVGEMIDYLSQFGREDKIQFDNDGDWEFLDKKFDWLLTVCPAKSNVNP